MAFYRKHTVIPKREPGFSEEGIGEMMTYTLSSEELDKYRSLESPKKMSKPFMIPIRK